MKKSFFIFFNFLFFIGFSQTTQISQTKIALDDKLSINKFFIIKNNINIYSLPKYFNLAKNGFQLLNLNKSINLKKSIEKFKSIDGTKDFINEKNNIKKHMTDYVLKYMKNLKNLGYNSNIEYDNIIVIDGIFRNTDINKKTDFKAVTFAHVDFDDFMTDHAFIYPFINVWNDTLENVLGKNIYDKKYWKLGKRIVKVFNVWISLTEPYIQNDHLILCDKNTFSQKELIPFIASKYNKYTNKRDSFIGQTLQYNKKHKWYTKKNMKMGEAYIFDPFKTSHGSTHSFNNFSRKSIEFRILFIRNKDIPEHVQNYYLKL